MYLEKAKLLLEKEYNDKYLLAEARGKRLMNEKIKHSYQVLGTGLMLLSKEAAFSDCDNKELDFLKAIVLLHDIGRFYEGVVWNIDHGVYGAELLKNVELFNNNETYLPIKHHGHLIEEFYQDKLYLSLPQNEQNVIKKYIFLIRDADKLANFYLLYREFDEYGSLFFSQYDGVPNIISEEVLNQFMKHKSIDKKNVKNYADQALMSMACIYDLNFRYSFVFLKKMGVLNRLFDCIAKFWTAEERNLFEKEISLFVDSKIKDL